MNLRIFSNFNQNTTRWFQASFQRVLGVLMTWWCLVIFESLKKKTLKNYKKLWNTPKTQAPQNLRKPASNHSTVFWPNFQKQIEGPRMAIDSHDLTFLLKCQIYDSSLVATGFSNRYYSDQSRQMIVFWTVPGILCSQNQNFESFCKISRRFSEKVFRKSEIRKVPKETWVPKLHAAILDRDRLSA